MRDPIFTFSAPRTVQSISHEDEHDFAIRLSQNALASTHYLSQLPQQLSARRMRAAARTLSETFRGRLSISQLQSQHESLLRFHRHITGEEHRKTFEGINEFIENFSPAMLSPDDRTSLWDNLIHHLWVEYNQTTIEHIVEILVTDHFLRIHRVVEADDELEQAQKDTRLKMALQARVVISARVDNRTEPETTFGLTARQHQLLENIHQRNIRAQKLSRIRELKDKVNNEIRRLEHQAITSPSQPTATAAATTSFTTVATTQRIASTISLDALNLDLSDDTNRTFERIRKGVFDARELLSLAQEEFESVELDQDDSLDDDIEEESTLLVMGSEISVEEKIPGMSLLAGLNEEEEQQYVDVTYFREHAEPILADADASINGRRVSGELLPERVKGFQTFRFPLPEPTQNPVSLQLHLSINANQVIEPEPMVVTHLQTASAILPWQPEDLDEIGTPPPPLFGVNKIGMVDFYQVEQELACFEAGEPSRTENLLAREYKERTTRRLDVTESETEQVNESSFEQKSDLETTTRNEIQAAVEEVLQQDSSRNINVNAGVSGGPSFMKFYANTAMTFSNSQSRQESRSNAIQYAKSVTEKVQRKITSKTSTKRRERHQQEYEEITKHGLDNRGGAEHVFGIYRWLDKIYNHYVVHMGQRTLLEFSIPEPAKRFIQAQELAVPEDDFSKRAPKKPKRFGVRVPNDVTRNNYRKLAAKYGVTIEAPPAHRIVLVRGYSESKPPLAEPIDLNDIPHEDVLSSTYDIEIPENYTAHFAKLSCRAAPSYHDAIRHEPSDQEAIPLQPGFYAILGTEAIPDHQAPFSEIQVERHLNPAVSTIFPVSIIMPWYHRTFSCQVEIRCRLRPRIFREWQLRAFNDVMDAYREQKAQYDEEKERHQSKLASSDLNPRFKKDIIQRELRQLALYMIQKPFNIKVAKNHYRERNDKLPKLKLTDKLDEHSDQVRFFEQAFDWDLMAYHLYPYYYAKNRSWSAKLSTQVSRNRTFDAFINSGMARLVVPIRLGFEDAVSYYLQTGKIWFGKGLVMDSENDLYLSIAQESIQEEGTVLNDTWQTKVPTNLTIVQDQAAALVGNGMPCLDNEGVGQGNSQLTPLPPEPDTPNGG